MPHSREILTFEPLFHEKIWGGHALESRYHYQLPDAAIGELWAISAHPHGDAVVDTGEFCGKHLSDLWREEHHSLFADMAGAEFPLLIKILDAQDNLSVQVHPDDAYAAEHEGGSLGKRECWYVLDAKPDTKIIVGQHAKSRQELKDYIERGAWSEALNYVPIHKGDFFAIEPGTMHAIMAGTLILETQQSSDITYRVYDFDRVDDKGATRPLHIEQSLDVCDYSQTPPTTGAVTAAEVEGITQLMSCENFIVEKWNAAEYGKIERIQNHPFLCVSVIEGVGRITTSSESVELAAGRSALVTAEAESVSLEGAAVAIVSYVPTC